jgi:hypothetical protein
MTRVYERLESESTNASVNSIVKASCGVKGKEGQCDANLLAEFAFERLALDLDLLLVRGKLIELELRHLPRGSGHICIPISTDKGQGVNKWFGAVLNQELSQSYRAWSALAVLEPKNTTGAASK